MLAATGYFLGGDSAGLLPVPMAICAALRPPLSLLSGSSFSTLWVSLILLPGWTWWVFVMKFFSLNWSHFTLNKCSNITWGLWNLKSPATWMFVQLLVMAKNNDIKDPHYWLALWISTNDQWFPSQRASNAHRISMLYHHVYSWIICLEWVP